MSRWLLENVYEAYKKHISVPMDSNKIITWDFKSIITENNEKIIFIPLWEWLLNLIREKSGFCR